MSSSDQFQRGLCQKDGRRVLMIVPTVLVTEMIQSSKVLMTKKEKRNARSNGFSHLSELSM
ncbi:hypothetical protein PGQ11_003065 [Apiospora arundinis]|uniref:Uncharacterized protein n=1 Tax=Apiospora arundinis TaxID=335852 RepID=A0ABR2J429_9PEZI